MKLPWHLHPWRPQCRPIRRTQPHSVQPLLRTQLPRGLQKVSGTLGTEIKPWITLIVGISSACLFLPCVSQLWPRCRLDLHRECWEQDYWGSPSFSLEGRVTCMWERVEGTPPPQSANLELNSGALRISLLKILFRAQSPAPFPPEVRGWRSAWGWKFPAVIQCWSVWWPAPTLSHLISINSGVVTRGSRKETAYALYPQWNYRKMVSEKKWINIEIDKTVHQDEKRTSKEKV